jgi:hypothetical protein
MTHSASKSSRSIGPRRKSTETSGLLPTPRANKITPQSREDFTPNLAYEIETALLPTPEALNFEGYQVANGKQYPRLGKVVSTSLPVASRASRSPQRDEEKARQTTAISGRRCLGLFESSGPGGSLVKTLRDLLLGATAWYSDKSLLTWKVKGTKSKHLLYQLAPSTLPTEEIESGLLRTPQASDGEKGGPNMRDSSGAPHLSMQVAQLLPTPVANDDNKSPAAHLAMKARMKGGPRNTITSLQVKIKSLLPTPRAQEAEGGVEKTIDGQITRKNGVRHGAKVKDILGTEAGLRLQPNFVEWMMGYPQNWTDLNYPSPA